MLVHVSTYQVPFFEPQPYPQLYPLQMDGFGASMKKSEEVHSSSHHLSVSRNEFGPLWLV